MYQPHPSSELNARFKQTPYQGVDPSSATFLFVGLDANYDADLEQSTSFRRVLEYHDDGVSFWRRHGVHHPFLLPEYRGDGRRYHRTFARIGFEPKHAHLVSFAELLHVPTVGRNKLTPTDLDRSHLAKLNDAMLHGHAQHVFVSAGVARLMHASGAFSWLPKAALSSPLLPTLYRDGTRSIYSYLHFSNYGKFQRQLDEECRAIGSLVAAHPGGTHD